MSKILAIFLCFIFTFWGIPQTSKTLAATPSCASLEIKVDITYNYNGSQLSLKDPTKYVIPDGVGAIFLNFSGIQDQHNYRWDSYGTPSTVVRPNAEGKMTLTASDPKLLEHGQHDGWLRYEKNKDNFEPYCTGVNYHIGNDYKNSDCLLTLTPSSKDSAGKLVVPTKRSITATISHAPSEKHFTSLTIGLISTDTTVNVDADGNASFIFQTPENPLDNAYVGLFDSPGGQILPLCSTNFNTRFSPEPTSPTCTISPNKDQITTLTPIQVIATSLPPFFEYQTTLINKTTKEETKLLDKVAVGNDGIAHLWLSSTHYLPEGKYEAQVFKSSPWTPQCTSDEFTVKPPDVAITELVKKCDDQGVECSKGGGDSCTANPDDGRGPAIATAIGCIHTNPAEFVKDLMKFVIGIGGGLAFLMMLLGAYQMLSSAGNPETLKAGQDRLTSAVTGLLFIIFAVLLLQIIGLDILGIPGFIK